MLYRIPTLKITLHGIIKYTTTRMKFKARGVFMLTCLIIIGIMLLLNHLIMTDSDSSNVRKLGDVIKMPHANGGHLHVLRKDLDDSNYKSESIKSENGDNFNDNKLKDGNMADDFEENIIKTIRETIHQSSVFKKKESLLKLVDTIQAQAKDEHFSEPGNDVKVTPNKDTYRIAWFGRPGNNSEMINLQPEHIQYLKKAKPYKRRFKNVKPKKSGFHENVDDRNLTSSRLFHKNINQYKLYDSKDVNIDHLLRDLNTMPISSMTLHEGGTQIKLVLKLNDGSRAMFKPMRFPRERETSPNHYYWSDFERHNAEIAAFHLDRILEFNSVPPTVGRVLNITSQIQRFADEAVTDTIFISPAGNVCFYGKCDYYCDSSHAVCGYPDTLEGSVMAYLPSNNVLGRKTWRSPWRRTYSKRKRFADWEKNPRYCEKIKRKSLYRQGRRLLDLMDMAVFDFLLGNLDRHHYETFTNFGNFTTPLHLDNGRAFGRPRFDDLSIIAPLEQCCQMRHSTLAKLINYNDGPLHLSDALRASLDKDPIAPILLDKHFAALDRRVKIILKTLHDCMHKSSVPYKSVVDDGF